MLRRTRLWAPEVSKDTSWRADRGRALFEERDHARRRAAMDTTIWRSRRAGRGVQRSPARVVRAERVEPGDAAARLLGPLAIPTEC